MNKKYSQEELDQILLSKVVLNFMTDGKLNSNI